MCTCIIHAGWEKLSHYAFARIARPASRRTKDVCARPPRAVNLFALLKKREKESGRAKESLSACSAGARLDSKRASALRAGERDPDSGWGVRGGVTRGLLSELAEREDDL